MAFLILHFSASMPWRYAPGRKRDDRSYHGSTITNRSLVDEIGYIPGLFVKKPKLEETVLEQFVAHSARRQKLAAKNRRRLHLRYLEKARVSYSTFSFCISLVNSTCVCM